MHVSWAKVGAGSSLTACGLGHVTWLQQYIPPVCTAGSSVIGP